MIGSTTVFLKLSSRIRVTPIRKTAATYEISIEHILHKLQKIMPCTINTKNITCK